MSYLGNLFSQTRSPARYRFENKFPKYFGAKKRIISWIASHTLAMTRQCSSKVKRFNNNVTNGSPFTAHRPQINETNFSRFTSHFSPFQKPAFTMAEVLITLGIIGIIAAMTLPSLIGKYQFKVFEVGLKKQYSLLQNAINLGVNEEGFQYCYSYYPKGSISYQEEKSDCDALQKYLISALKLKPFNGNLKQKYAQVNVVKTEGGKSTNWGCSYDNTIKNAKYYLSNDGAIFAFFTQRIIIDINGEKAPNRWGYDVFFMGLSNHNDYTNPSPKILLTDEFCSIIEKGGRFARTILRNQEVDSDTKIYW